LESSQDFLSKNSLDKFVQIVHIGYLNKVFEWSGHQFEIRTLRIDEELAVGQLVKEYKNTITEDRAVAVAIAAASIVSINEKPFMPRFDDDAVLQSIRDRFNYIRKNWHWPVIEIMNAQYLDLLNDVYLTIEESQNLSMADLRSSNSSSDPLIEQDLSKIQNT
jgi:hypothetical protein